VSLRLIVIPLALLTALALALIAFQLAQSPPSAVVTENGLALPPAPLLVNVLVAAHPVAPGALIRDEDFVAKGVAPHDLKEGSLQDSAEVRTELRGALLRRFLEANEPLQRGDLLRARDRGFLAAVLEPGTRAVSVAVDAVTGVSGLIWPGDKVDVILTQELDAQNVPLSRRVFGETVLTDVRVIAVDQQITQGGVANGSAEGVGKLAHTVTLQVASDQAERVAVANRLGRLALAVRAVDGLPPGSPASPPAAATVFSSDVSPELSASARRGGTRMRVIQGDHREEVTFQ
jgi:pilus assembly protein CpaB